MTFQILIGLTLALWLLSVAACAVAFRWSLLATPRRFVPAIVLAMSALAMGYIGLTHIRVSGSKIVNGHTQWAYDSKWFFIVTLVLAAATLAFTIWNYRKSLRPALATTR